MTDASLGPVETAMIRRFSRRQMIYAAVLGAAGLSGCVGDDEPEDVPLEEVDDTTTDIDLPDDEDLDDEDDRLAQAFVLPTTNNPEEGSIVMSGPPMPDEFETRYEHASEVYDVLYEPPIFGRFFHRSYVPAPGEPSFALLEDIEVTDDAFIFTIRDDAYWSDGGPITALDGCAQNALQRFNALPTEGQYMYDDRAEHDHPQMQYDEVRFPEGKDGKIWELVTHHDGWIGERWARGGEVHGWFYARIAHTHALNFPTHIEPYESLVLDTLDEMERGLGGEEVRSMDEIVTDHIDEGTFEHFRDPDNVISSGPWQLDEIRGAEEWVLRPNEYHRLADDIGWQEIRMPWIEADADHRLQAELRAGRLDYGQVLTQPDLVEHFEENYTQEFSPQAEGGGIIVFDHGDPVFGQTEVKHAIAHAIDQNAVAETVHPHTTQPVDVPGGDMFGRQVFVDDDWVEENLLSFEYDLDRADELMRQAGFERGGDGDWLHDGEPIEAEYPTPEDAPIEERVVVDQLNEFGLNLRLISMEADAYTDRYETSPEDFRIFPNDPFTPDHFVGHIMGWGALWWQWMNPYAWPESAIGRNLYSPENINRESYEMAEEDGIFWTEQIDGGHLEPYIEIPPVGEPDGELQRWHVLDEGMNILWRGGPGHDEFEAALKRMIWATNWFLPAYPIYNLLEQHWLNTTNWFWPDEHESWDYFGEAIQTNDYLSLGMIDADPEQPK